MCRNDVMDRNISNRVSSTGIARILSDIQVSIYRVLCATEHQRACLIEPLQMPEPRLTNPRHAFLVAEKASLIFSQNTGVGDTCLLFFSTNSTKSSCRGLREPH